MALARFGEKRIADYDDNSDTEPAAVYCRLFFDQTVKQLMRSHLWRFAQARVRLSADSNWDTTNNTTTDWGYTYRYHLPADFLRVVLVWNGSERPQQETGYIYQLERGYLLSDESSCYLRYVKWVEDVGSWDPLFIQLVTMELSKQLAMPLAQSLEIKQDIEKELEYVRRRVRAMDRNEQERIGRHDLRPWRDARYSDTA